MRYLTAYLQAIGGIRRDGDATEMSYRLAIGNMLRAAATEFAPQGGEFGVLHEPQRRPGGGAPDFRVDFAGGGAVGYVECKKPGEDLPGLAGGEQLRRYANLSPNILLTDGWRWLALKNGAQADDIRLPANAAPGAAKRAAFADLLRTFFAAPPESVADAKKLATRLAARCDILRRELTGVITTKDAGRLKGLYDAFKGQIYRDMKEDAFADAFAQTLTYSLLMARLRAGAGGGALDLFSAQGHIPQTFTLIRELSNFLAELAAPRYASLRWAVDDILALVNNMDVAAIAETISAAQTAGMEAEDDPFTHFYENFLAAYDAKQRQRRGVYYTPLPVVRFIVRAVDDILKADFSMPEGLADEKVTSLDFAAGTGTFMQETMRQALNNVSPATRPSLARDRLLPNCHGFEFMIAPYVIAHLKLSHFLADQGCPIDENAEGKALNIFLTDTLEGVAERAPINLLPWLSEEARLAGEAKKKRILVVMGNPPYSGHSQTASKEIIEYQHEKIQGKKVKEEEKTWIGNLLADYYLVDGEPLGVSNTKWLQDDYVKFIRFAQDKMEGVKRGVVAIITNHGFLVNRTFCGMRHSLMKAFDRLYFLDLHGNARRSETAEPDENVFAIQQGVCISLLVKNSDLPKGIFHCDLYGVRKSKNEFCLSRRVEDVEWTELQPEKEDFFLFKPMKKEGKETYFSLPYWSVRDMFEVGSVGIVTARDKLTIAFDEEEIRRRTRDFAAMPPEEARERYALGRDARDWSVERAQKDLRGGKLAEENFRRIVYRPFDARHTYYTGNSRGFHCMPRGEVMSHMLQVAGNIGLGVAKSQEIDGEWRHVFVADSLAHNNFATRKETTTLLPMWQHEENVGRPPNKKENLAPAFRKWLDERYQPRLSVEEVMGYVYAVLHSPDYRDRWSGFLRLHFPRIPFPPEREKIERMAAIGKRLINAHLLRDSSLPLTAELRGDGKNLRVEGMRNRHEGDRLYVNQGAWFSPVPAEVFAFSVGGYQPLQKYLEDRNGRQLTLAEMETIRKIIAAIAFTQAQIREIPAID